MVKLFFMYLIVIYGSWLGMMAVHESGHALGALLTGGHVQRIVLPILGFSRTDVSPNLNPLLEVWAGPVWGCVVPLSILLIARRPWPIWRFFAGFCLIANGSYLAVGWSMHAGDAWELVRLGMPRSLLTGVGLIGVSTGLFIWHRMDHRCESASATDAQLP